MRPSAARLAVERLARAVESDAFAGWDPYDALASPLLRGVARTRLMRGGAIQALRRSPVNARRILGVPKQEHAMGLALLASGYATLARLDDDASYAERATDLAARLTRHAIANGDTAGYGYDFDVQTRWGYYRAGQPNAVVTAFAAHALLDAAELGADGLREHAVRAVRYGCERLLPDVGSERYFAYYEGSTTAIHNASLLLAGAVCRLAEPGSDEWHAAAAAFSYTLARQRPDGSWPYGEDRGLTWVDGYHTAFLFECLALWHQRSGDSRALAALERGLDLYLERLIDPDGAPRATLERRYPIDIHAAAFAVAVLAQLYAYDRRALPAAARVLEWTLARMRRDDGRFAFRRHRLYRNGIPYVRWSDAPMLLALARYLVAEDQRG